MKSYTDLGQSEKLAEILPHESADMVLWGKDFKYVYADIHSQEFMKGLEDRKMNYVPCWSLAALIDILPPFIKFKDDKYYLRFMKEYVEYANDEISLTGRYLHTTGNDNLVDACVEMIIKLHELNLL